MGCTVAIEGLDGESLPEDVPLTELAICDQTRLILEGCDGSQYFPQSHPIGNLVSRLPVVFFFRVVRVVGARFALLRVQ